MGASTPGIASGFVGAVGQTPLIRLNALSALTGCEILGKAEFMNPGGSVKDRAALGILLEAEEQGVLKPCLLYTSPSPRDATLSRMPSSA